MSVEQIIKGVVNQSPSDVKDGFEDAIQNKIIDIVNNKKIEVAQSYFDSPEDKNPPEDPDDDQTDDDDQEDDDFDVDVEDLEDEELDGEEA